ncbi:MAG: hypothetical protein BMS9Abin05_2261 [Rhodothermia bacterium]|nr:MAG: hypothetical protein BMS9Abin05_2261 [Rhodothermia bacterium]
MNETGFAIWDGIYETFAQSSGDENVFESTIWIKKISERAKESLRAMRAESAVPAVAVNRSYILPVIGALVQARRGKLSVLDFGGGLGASYLPTIAGMPAEANVEFHVVEGEAVVKEGRKLFEDYPQLHFYSELPSLDEPIDIVHAGSALHYVEEWKSMLGALVHYAPRYLIFADLPAGNIKTFVTIQNFHGRKIPVWFWDIAEFTSAVEGLGFRYIYRCRCVETGVKAGQQLPMSNFPERYRLDYTCQLLFERD